MGIYFRDFPQWISASVIAVFLPVVLVNASNPGYVFSFFAFMMVLQLLYVYKLMPETKGVSLEELQKQLIKPVGGAVQEELV